MAQVKVAQFGLGPIGVESVKLAAEKDWIDVVGGIDIDPAKIGKSVGDVTGDSKLAGAKIYKTFEELYEKHKPDVVLHTAGSKADVSIKQIMPMAERGVSVVSSCEELLVPSFRAPALSKELDEVCKKHNARVLGTGVNPGFVMDVLPVCITGVSRTVEHIYCERVVNATTRRMPLQKKIGSGMEPDEMRRLFKEGKAGHAGFLESLALIGYAMGWKFTETYELFEPMIAPYDIKTKFFDVKRGQCCGIHQQVVGKVGNVQRVYMDLKMYLDAQDPHDAVRITGDPPLEVRVNGGIAGDHATVASLVNAIPRVLKAPPGVLMMTDIAVPGAGVTGRSAGKGSDWRTRLTKTIATKNGDGDSVDEDPLATDQDLDESDDVEETIVCPFCQRPLHEDADVCPRCGNFIAAEDAPRQRLPMFIWIGVILAGLCVLTWVLTR